MIMALFVKLLATSQYRNGGRGKGDNATKFWKIDVDPVILFRKSVPAPRYHISGLDV